MITCSTCGHFHPSSVTCVGALLFAMRKLLLAVGEPWNVTSALALLIAMRKLLQAVGEPGTCKGCGAEIFWVTHSNGKKTPYTPAGLNHFIDCSKAKEFKK